MLFYQSITAARVLATLDKACIPRILLNTTKNPVRLLSSLSLVHCPVLKQQPVLWGCSIPGAQGSKSGATELTKKPLVDLVASHGMPDLHLSANETEELIAIIGEYADVFASSDVDLGRIRGAPQSTQQTQLLSSRGPIVFRTVSGPNWRGKILDSWMRR